MTSNEDLFIIAELSVALAGFSGVVVGLRRRTGALSRQDVFGMIHILTSSGTAMVFSLLPSVLQAAGVGGAAAWRTTSLALGLLVTVASLAWASAGRRTRPRYPVTFWGFVSTGLVVGISLLLTSSGLFEYAGSLVPLTLLWLLLVAFSQFVAFLAVLWAPPEPDGP